MRSEDPIIKIHILDYKRAYLRSTDPYIFDSNYAMYAPENPCINVIIW